MGPPQPAGRRRALPLLAAAWLFGGLGAAPRLASAQHDPLVINGSSATLVGHKSGVYSVAWAPDGNTLATASGDNTAKVWSATTHALLATLVGHKNWVYSGAFAPDGNTLATA